MTTSTSPLFPVAKTPSRPSKQSVDCVVLDLRLPDISGFDVLERFRDTPQLGSISVVVFTGKEASRPRETLVCMPWLQRLIIKEVELAGTIVQQVSFVPAYVVADLPGEKQRMLDRLHHLDDALVGKKV